MTPTEALQAAIDKAGGQAQLGALVDPPVSKSAVSQWIQRGRCPADRALQIQQATGISCHDLRPDVFGEASGKRHPQTA